MVNSSKIQLLHSFSYQPPPQPLAVHRLQESEWADMSLSSKYGGLCSDDRLLLLITEVQIKGGGSAGSGTSLIAAGTPTVRLK